MDLKRESSLLNSSKSGMPAEVADNGGQRSVFTRCHTRVLPSRGYGRIRGMRVIPILLLLSRCAMAANPPVNFTFNAGVTCSGICISPAIQISAVTTDAAGNTYFTGNVNSTKLPTTPNVFQPMLASGSCAVPFTPYPCSDAFVVKLDPQGDVAWATYLGGNGADVGTAVAVDADGNVFIAGSSTAE